MLAGAGRPQLDKARKVEKQVLPSSVFVLLKGGESARANCGLIFRKEFQGAFFLAKPKAWEGAGASGLRLGRRGSYRWHPKASDLLLPPKARGQRRHVRFCKHGAAACGQGRPRRWGFLRGKSKGLRSGRVRAPSRCESVFGHGGIFHRLGIPYPRRAPSMQASHKMRRGRRSRIQRSRGQSLWVRRLEAQAGNQDLEG